MPMPSYARKPIIPVQSNIWLVTVRFLPNLVITLVPGLSDTVVVLDLLSNTAYMGTDGDELLLPALRAGTAVTTSSIP